jgi:hypothetical protein
MNRVIQPNARPAVRADATVVGLRDRLGMRRRALAAVRPYLYILPTFFFLFFFTHFPILKTFHMSLFKKMRNIFVTTFQEILDEKYTPEEGMKKAQAEIEKVLAPYQK